MSQLTQERIALNQAAFRDANERIETAADDIHLDGPVPFICECADPSCVTIVPMHLDEYERIRESPRRFFTAPGHEQIAVRAGAGVVLGRRPGYVLVEKVGVAGDVAAENAPRGVDA